MNIADILAALTWRDGLDLVLLYIVAYIALRLLKGTRALPVLLSVLFFAVMGVVAQILDLVAIAVILKYFLEYVIIILIVVFNQELRRFLLRMGQRLLPTVTRKAQASAVRKLVVACDRLAKARVGALFIIEGQLDVLHLSGDSGAEIDATLNTETLVALQVPHGLNTAHDGAVLIRDLRIARAGVILPLSDQNLDPRFGTRHRGAIGVSEETDALVIVLSEERGEIRVAERGAISEPLGGPELEERIYSWFDSPPPAPEERELGSRVDMAVVEEPSAASAETDAEADAETGVESEALEEGAARIEAAVVPAPPTLTRKKQEAG
jgi:uncharacterized protein (TIGR00159 family)